MSNSAIAQVYNDMSTNGTSYTTEGVRKHRNKVREIEGCPDLSNLIVLGLGCDERQDPTDFGQGDCRKEEHASVTI